MRYQTEIHVSADRYVCLQLPTYFPEGRAMVTVTIEAEGQTSSLSSPVDEVDREDIEWWDEFDEEIGHVP
jgi:predicted HD phosphohydrolase